MTERDRIYIEMIRIAYPLGAEYQELSGIMRLAEAGYRKEEEVKRETANWIYKALLGTEHIKELEQKEHCEWWVSRWRIEDLNRVFKDFGVEVEE